MIATSTETGAGSPELAFPSPQTTDPQNKCSARINLTQQHNVQAEAWSLLSLDLTAPKLENAGEHEIALEGEWEGRSV